MTSLASCRTARRKEERPCLLLWRVFPHCGWLCTVFGSFLVCFRFGLFTTIMLSIRSSLASLATRRARTFSTQRHSLDEPSDVIRGVYVHHVTKVVLQHLQENKADWLVEQGLDRGLRLNGNGTAVLHFPSKKKGFDSGRIW